METEQNSREGDCKPNRLESRVTGSMRVRKPLQDYYWEKDRSRNQILFPLEFLGATLKTVGRWIYKAIWGYGA